MKATLFTAAIAAAALGLSAPAGATEMVTNGTFETGDFNGWLQTEPGMWVTMLLGLGAAGLAMRPRLPNLANAAS